MIEGDLMYNYLPPRVEYFETLSNCQTWGTPVNQLPRRRILFFDSDELHGGILSNYLMSVNESMENTCNSKCVSLPR